MTIQERPKKILIPANSPNVVPEVAPGYPGPPAPPTHLAPHLAPHGQNFCLALDVKSTSQIIYATVRT